MKKRRRLTIGLAALAGLGLLLIVAKRDRGPEVDGQPLEAWVRGLLNTAVPGRRAALLALNTNLFISFETFEACASYPPLERRRP